MSLSLVRWLLVAAMLAAVGIRTPDLDAFVGTTTAAAPTGVDISWPECPHTMGIPSRRGQDKPMPAPTSQFVIVGLTNGPAFHRNPCIAREMTWVRNHDVWRSAYSVTTYPHPAELSTHGRTGPYGTADVYARLRNVGWSQARFNAATMRANHVVTPFVWVDVEYSPGNPWSGSAHRNRAVVNGLLAGYRAAGYRVGIYSTRSMWADIVGGHRFDLPEWRTAGQTSQSVARRRCGSAQIQGGRAVLAQWSSPSKDYDLLCPGYGAAAMPRFFHQY
jgi:hypothetical protein